MSKLFRLFVYGTLKSGFSNHDRFCSNARSITTAAAYGSLYDLPYGFPAFLTPSENILSLGSADIDHDLTIQYGSWNLEPNIKLSKVVHGELITFKNAEKFIPSIDYLEGFRPGGDSMYDRVLIPIQQDGVWLSAWTYKYNGPARGKPVLDGNWRGKCHLNSILC